MYIKLLTQDYEKYYSLSYGTTSIVYLCYIFLYIFINILSKVDNRMSTLPFIDPMFWSYIAIKSNLSQKMQKIIAKMRRFNNKMPRSLFLLGKFKPTEPTCFHAYVLLPWFRCISYNCFDNFNRYSFGVNCTSLYIKRSFYLKIGLLLLAFIALIKRLEVSHSKLD